MKHIPSYGKVLALGSAGTESALDGEVVVQEKIDGSCFGFGVNEDGELTIRSRNRIIEHTHEVKDMFSEGVQYLLSIHDRFVSGYFLPDTYIYGEYLQKPKQNVLRYERIPNNHIILFDCIEQGKWTSRERLCEIAEYLDLEVVPQLYVGEVIADEKKTMISYLLDQDSVLGKERVEGIVIKNYGQLIEIQGRISPVRTKVVRESFKERHKSDSDKNKISNFTQEYSETFRTEARWLKSSQYLRDIGELEMAPRDIGKLIKRVHEDIEEEEKENIKNELYKRYIGQIKRASTRGLPEWWKNKLIERLDEDGKKE